MVCSTGDAETGHLRLDFDRFAQVEFRGAHVIAAPLTSIDAEIDFAPAEVVR